MIKYQSDGLRKGEGPSHRTARLILELWLKAKGRSIMADNLFTYPSEFVKQHHLQKRFQGHSYDILTNKEIIEIDDYGKHSKKGQIINDGIAEDYARKHLNVYKFYRVQKEELLDLESCADYLKDALPI